MKTAQEANGSTPMVAESQLFQHLNFLIVVTNADRLESAHITAQLLRSNGCNRCLLHEQYLERDAPRGENLRDWFVRKFGQDDFVNFIISEDCDFPFYTIAAFDFLIPVVTSEWVSTCLSTNRHHRTSGFSPDKRHVLRDLQIYVSRHAFNHSEYICYTEMVHAMGGTCIDFLSSKTTHLVTQDPGDPAVKAVLGFGKVDSINFVFPTWIVESFKTLKIAKSGDHLVDPRVSSETSSARLQDLWDDLDELHFQPMSATLEGHSFVIGLDVSLNKNLYATLIEFLQANGGTVIRHIDENDIRQSSADCYIGSTVMTEEYDAALDSGLELGNLIWLFYMWSSKQFISPKAKLVFAPFKKKLFDVNEVILSYSNYYGQQRYYIQRLAELLGGYSTGELSRKNTHLVSQFPWGKKFETAQKWEKCIVVNHLWLETIYQCGKVIDPLEARFQEFPVLGGLQHAIGQTGGEKAVAQYRSTVKEVTETPSVLQGKEEEEINQTIKEAETDPANLETESKAPSQLVTAADNGSVTGIIESNVDNEHLPTQKTVRSTEDPPVVGGKSEALLDDGGTYSAECFNEELPQTPGLPQIEDEMHSGDTANTEVARKGSEESSDKSQLPQAIIDDIHSDPAINKADTPTPDASSQMDKGQLATPISDEEKHLKAQTPLLSSMPSQTLLSSGGRRAAKAKAARKLHSDIELLNEFQRNSKRKKTGDLLPEEIAQLERRKLLEQRANNILQKVWAIDNTKTSGETNRRRRTIFSMNAICTGCHDDIGELDRVLLEKLGIRVHEDITKENVETLDTIIAPKKMRTAKFLKSFGFHPLRYALKPEFLTDILRMVHNEIPLDPLPIDLSTYRIPEVDPKHVLQMTSQPTKVFERAGITNINLVNDITGGVEVISSILKAHGIKEVRVVPTVRMNQLTIKDLALNNAADSEAEDESRAVPDCVMIVMKSSQVKHYKRIVKNGCQSAMAVEWNWCISSIFRLDVDYSDSKNIVFRQEQSVAKKSSK